MYRRWVGDKGGRGVVLRRLRGPVGRSGAISLGAFFRRGKSVSFKAIGLALNPTLSLSPKHRGDRQFFVMGGHVVGPTDTSPVEGTFRKGFRIFHRAITPPPRFPRGVHQGARPYSPGAKEWSWVVLSGVPRVVSDPRDGHGDAQCPDVRQVFDKWMSLGGFLPFRRADVRSHRGVGVGGVVYIGRAGHVVVTTYLGCFQGDPVRNVSFPTGFFVASFGSVDTIPVNRFYYAINAIVNGGMGVVGFFQVFWGF